MAEEETFYNPNTRRMESRKIGQAITKTGEMRLRQIEDEKSKEQVEAEGGLAAAAARQKKKRELSGLAGTVAGKMSEDKILKTGNPYEIARVKGMHVVRHKGGGGVKGKFKSYKQALRQFNLLEGIYHGWKPTGKPARR